MSSAAPPRDAVFACAGEMARRCAAHDWADTPLGAPHAWPAGLRTTVGMLLRSRFPMIVTWGEEFVMIYNDAYIATLGSKHPTALGGRLPDVFAEIWDVIGPQQRAVLRGEGTRYDENVAFVLERGSGPEETYYTFSWSHVPPDAEGDGPGGVLTVLTERTVDVVGTRRFGLLTAMRARTDSAQDPLAALSAGLDVLEGATLDIIGAGVCLLDDPSDGGPLHLGPWFGLPWSDPDLLVAHEEVGACLADGRPHTGHLAHSGAPLVTLPIRARDRQVGVLALAPHPLRPLDEAHRQWLALVADQLSQALGLATARADEQRRIADLSRLDTVKTDFLSNISHEFRTPLALLLGPIEDALEQPAEPLTTTQLESMHRHGTRLLRLVNNVLDVARMDLDPRGPAMEPVELTSATHDLLVPFEAAARRAGLAFATRLDEVGVVLSDPALWEATVINLVANAIKYTPSGSVDVTLTRHGGDIALRVRDTGMGIPESEQPLVFDRFHRVTGPAMASVQGTGLGLALVAESVRALGGSITLDSVPGQGSVFTVLVSLESAAEEGRDLLRSTSTGASDLARDLEPVPVAGTAGDPGHPHPEAGEAGEVGEVGEVTLTDPLQDERGPTILVVDDNRAMRERVARVLSHLGGVITCGDGVEALAVLELRDVDLLVTDVMMARLDGLGLVERLRADQRHAALPIVVLSARAGRDTAAAALDLGADDYVVKPFTTSELLARCRSTLELSRLRSERAGAAARNRVIAGVSHELQTPLSVIMSALDLLGSPGTDEAVRAEAVRRASARVLVLDRLVRQFLDWSRITAGSPIEAVAQPVDLDALVHRVVAAHPIARLDDAPTDCGVVSCDLRRTEQILHTLLLNAAQAGATRADVRVLPPVDGQDAGLGIEVHDDGCGLDEATARGLFTPTSASETPGAVGIALAVSRAAARAQGGDLALVSSDQQGSTFVLRLAGGA